MRNIRPFIALLALCCLLPHGAIAAEGSLAFTIAPDVLRPGKYYEIEINSPAAANASLSLHTADGDAAYAIYTDFPFAAGLNRLGWDGRRVDHSVVEPGEYSLRAELSDGQFVETPMRVGAPYPMLSQITQSDSVVADTPVLLTFTASEAGTLMAQVQAADGAMYALPAASIVAGEGSLRWDGTVEGIRIPDGECTMILTLRAANGTESMPEYIFLQVGLAREEAAAGGAAVPPAIIATDVEPEPTPEPTPEPPSFSAPYSDLDDGTFWSMTPGETDPAAIWEILTQPITVYDDGKISTTEHVYLMENPDGSGEKLAQIHGKSQGLHVLGEENEHGYVLAEAFSNFDRSYIPKTDEERAHAFDVKQGYIKAGGLKTIQVQQDMGLVIDKKTQRMYLYVDGVAVTELLIATGKISSEDDYLYETIPGEYITVSHTGDFPSGNMICRMAIRINGGILLHEVPHKVNADGTRNYSSFEGYLGTKQSHGCVRIQRLKNEDGYNHQWLWDNLKRGAPYKVIIWDDLNRVDEPATRYPNPTN